MLSTPARAVRAPRCGRDGARDDAIASRGDDAYLGAATRGRRRARARRDAREGEDRAKTLDANARGSDADEGVRRERDDAEDGVVRLVVERDGGVAVRGVLPLARTERGDGAGRGVRGDDRVGGD